VFILTTETLPSSYITIKSVTQQFPDCQCHIHANNSLIAVSRSLLIKMSTQSDAITHVILRWTLQALLWQRDGICAAL